ncbi:MAG TPA: Hsp70 family protein [Micromonosporaceae bacterium]|nr:Hsp70 family protein [Micromonosporaceae bacterium]
MYTLGIDLGTTYTAAATWRNGHAEVASLGSRAAAIPSVVLLRQDETILTGETASRRGQTEPHRVAREFKRRLGDTTPILLGGVPYSADALMAKLLRTVIDEVSAREGEEPAALCVSHPANWGPYKMDLLHQTARMAGLEQPVRFTSEPEAAAVYYAHQQRMAPGAIVAVYDLGGGTFDAAVLRKTETGFQILGQPEGIERLGGIDFDAAVFDHVRRALGGKLEELDEEDPTAIAAVARLRDECVEAKEALSSDTDVSIPVLLPNLATEVRLTRAELEAMARPALHSSIEALNRALRSAGVTSEQLHSVLLVGGSSRMPLVAQLVGAELNRPVAVDTHPKHTVSLGAAWLAADTLLRQRAGAGAATPPPVSAAPAQPPRPGTAHPPAAHPPATAVSGVHPPRAAATAVSRQATTYSSAAAGLSDTSADAPPEPPAPPVAAKGRPRGLLIGAGALVVALFAAGGVALAMKGDSEDPGKKSVGQSAPPADDNSPAPAPSGGPSPDTSTEPAVPADEQCTDEIKANDRWVCLTKATWDGKQLVIEYDAEWAGGKPRVSGGFHLHVYGGDGTSPKDEVMGAHHHDRGVWKVSDQRPAILNKNEYDKVIGDYDKVCARIANSRHELVPDGNGSYKTGNCVPIERS